MDSTVSMSGSSLPPETGAKAGRAALRAVFTRRLNEEMDRRKWTLATLLREAGPHLPEGFKLSHSHLWHYLRGKALPHEEIRRALSLALGADLERLPPGDDIRLPTPGAEVLAEAPVTADAPGARLVLADLGGGMARLSFDQDLPWPVVLRILETIRGEGA
jgi:hypothetical protein